ncbi:phage virion morphogenesis protein, partial [Laribacter hongkongensis]
MIDIKIDCSGVMQTLERLEQAVTQRAPVMRAIAEVMHEAVLENFIQEGRPKWQGLKPPGRPGGTILQSHGQLLSSITPSSNNDNAVVSTNTKYAAIHQFGGKTRPHEIRPRNAKA